MVSLMVDFPLNHGGNYDLLAIIMSPIEMPSFVLSNLSILMTFVALPMFLSDCLRAKHLTAIEPLALTSSISPSDSPRASIELWSILAIFFPKSSG